MTAPRDQWMRETGENRHAVQAYLAANSFIDHCVGMILDSLASSSAADNTYVVLWSDHGFHLGEKRKWAKRSLWERTTRVPLIFAGPGISGGTPSVEPAGLIDVWPTLNELCQLPRKDDIEGVSLLPQLKDPATPRDQPTITTFGKNNHSIRSRDFRYTLYMDGSEELYDHRKDPDEITNLASDPAFSGVIESHKKWLPKVNAEPVPDSRGSDSPLYGEGEGLQKAMRRKG